MISFQNRTTVISGAAHGIGRETAWLMARAGATVALCDLDTGGLQRLQSELSEQGLQATIHPLDIADSRACQATAEDIARQHRQIDHLVHCAGIYPEQRVRDMSDEQWLALQNINLNGTFYLCRAVIPHLAEDSAIVTLSSVAGHQGSHSHGHYAASKGGVSSLSKSLARELAPRTRVNIVAPGIIATAMTERLIQQQGTGLLERTPMQRFGTATDVAGAIAFLCSDLARFVNGETLHVNGGLYIV